METATISPVKEKFIASIEAHESGLTQTNPEVVTKAKYALEALDFPTTRHEEWKYTRTARISNEQWKIIENKSRIDITPFMIPKLNADVLVFVNGFYRDEFSQIASQNGVTISKSIEEFEYDAQNFFQVLNVAYCTSALSIQVAKNIVAEKPIHILHIITNEKALAQAHITINVAQSSQLHVVESFVVAPPSPLERAGVRSFTNRSLKISVAENAQVHLDKIQMEGDENFLLNEDNIHIDGNGRFTINTLTVDGGWVRNSLNISLDGQNIEANLNAIFLPRRKQFVDNHTKVNHRFPNCNSNELYKGILNNQSIGVFNGKVYVQPDAQKTNAYQSNANILLSDDAQMNTKPELEIYADDVKCSHGTTTGQMDENALFYLKSRGLGDENARRLLTTAFINDVLDKVENEEVKEYVVSELVKRELLFN
ncbi:MAG: Fe-S cluster assembly protein SufD [Flavobacteriales bacterium]